MVEVSIVADFYELMVHIKPNAKFTDREEHTFCRIRFNSDQLENLPALHEKVLEEFKLLLPEVLYMVSLENRRSR